MHRYKNIAVTGEKGAGKSTLAAWLLEKLGKSYGGFRTERCRVTEAGPIYDMVDIRSGERRPISRVCQGAIRGIPETFGDFGVKCLVDCLSSGDPVLLLDEIGRFERSSQAFLRTVWSVLDSEKTVIAVLKKEELPHIAAIKARPDTLVIDLDEAGRAGARQRLAQWLMKP